MSQSRKIVRNLIIADTQEITSLGLKVLVDVSPISNIAEIFMANDKSTLIRFLSENENSLVVLDYTLFDFASITEIQILMERYPESSWILFSDELSDSFLRQMLMNDLSFSIVFKSNHLDEITSAFKSAFMYQRYLTVNIENHLKILKRSINDVSDYNLTITEKEILKEMALGKTTKQIAYDRNVSFHTIMTHRKNIFRKLDVNNVHEAIKYGMKAGVVDLSDYYI